MDDHESERQRDTSPRTRASWRRGALLVGVLGVVALAASACGGGLASPGVAQLGSTTTTAPVANAASPTPFAGLQAEYQYALSYAQCMRTHGVPGLPDPTRSSRGMSFNPKADSSSPQFAKANATCKHLLPDDGGRPSASELAEETTKLLKYAQCMQNHGITNFPDPIVNPHQIGFSLNGIDPSSPQFQRAQQACKSLGIGGA
jgi:hypothetical protein